MKADAGERTRPIMWRGAWQIFREHPTWGGGAGSFNVRFEKFRPEHYQDEPQWAHNDYINTLSDYGAAGFILFFGAGAVIAVRGARERLAAAAGLARRAGCCAGALTAGVVAFGLQLFVDFHFKIPALAMAFALAAALLVQRAWPGGARRSRRWRARVARWALAAAVFAVLVAAGVWVDAVLSRRVAAVLRRGRPSTRWQANEPGRETQREILARARADLTRAVEISPGNAQAWADLSYVSALWSHVDPARAVELGREAEQTADRALAKSQIVPEFWLRHGVALDLQGRWAEAGDALRTSRSNLRPGERQMCGSIMLFIWGLTQVVPRWRTPRRRSACALTRTTSRRKLYANDWQ